MSAELRDWQPGDGLVCSYSKRSPIPCGRPVKTAVSTESQGPQRGNRIMRRPLCELHAAGRMGGMSPGQLRMQAERNAYQWLAHKHWSEFTEYVEQEIARLSATPEVRP